MSNIVAIVGRPNVGKSTLFNRLVEKRKAIMDDESGVTRDRSYDYSEWNGRNFITIDTGGYVNGSHDIFEKAIREQVEIAIEEATVILFVVDSFVGLTGYDQDFAHVLRSSKKPVLVVANKADNNERMHMSTEFYELGMGDVYPISAINGSGTGELLDEVVKNFGEEETKVEGEGIPRITILGRPNVGKSSYLNVLLGEDRSIVTNIAGTTRDAIDTRYKLYGKDFILTDTAGIRKKNKAKENVEFYSTMRAIQSLQNSDICIVIIDATLGLESQDVNIISLAHRYKKGVVLLINKWDLIEKKDGKTADQYKKLVVEKLAPLDFIPIIFTSVLKKQRIFQSIEKAIAVWENRNKKISTSKLNDIMLKEIESYPPPSVKGKYIKIKYITQLPSRTPTFAFFCNLPQYLKNTYERFLENKLRQHFDFEGVPIKLYFRKK